MNSRDNTTPRPWKVGKVSGEIYAQDGTHIATMHIPASYAGMTLGDLPVIAARAN